MTDLTPLFRQCVNIVQSELKESIKNDFDSSQTRKSTNQQFIINDTFMKESLDFRRLLNGLEQFITDVKTPYLSSNDSDANRGSGSLSFQDKNRIDEEFNYKIQQMYEKLKLLQTYETKRQSLVPKKEGGWLSNYFGEEEPSDQELFLTTVNTHRMQILRDLNNHTNQVSNSFGAIQKRRQERERQLNSLNFQNLEEEDDDDLNYIQGLNSEDISYDLIQEEEESKGFSMGQLSQEQVQELEKENQEFLKMKSNQLKEVEKLHSSMVDIMNLQTELSFQLETQGDQINNLMDNHSQVEIDVQMGNKTLNKASVRNKKGANMLVMLGIILGILLLCVDYISF